MAKMAPQRSLKFKRIALIGIGLIGSSLARAVRQHGLADHIAICTRSDETLEKAKALKLGDSYTTDAATAAKGADLVMLAVPLGATRAVGEAIAQSLKNGAIVSDAGSSKAQVLKDLAEVLPDGVHLVPGHPVAGTEFSGPEAGYASLFDGHWCVLTPGPETDADAVGKVQAMWQAVGMKVETMDAEHHDRVMAITSHLPQLIAYTIVGTATDLQDDTRREVMKYSAGGFRDFTRIAASDPVMWRDVCLNNKDAILDILGRFSEDLSTLQRAIRRDEGDTLFDLFTRTRDIRRGIIEMGQDKPDIKPEDED
ncbi:MAG: prephenate/arogenate dehydrogenase family protein [Rhodospirillaceae bacterium]|nr:prephenate/arogenate dehydrogenase family protein [Rhodospirillaceae bacterium]